VKTEMDAMALDERQRTCWLHANRLTLILVGLLWLGLIGWELAHHRTPYFLIVMVPVIALIRLATYKYYLRRI